MRRTLQTGAIRILTPFLFVSVLVSFAAAASPLDKGPLLDPVRVDGIGTRRPGQTVHLSWNPLPPGVEEFEILLEARLPRPLLLRLTECEDPALTGLDLVLPSLPADSARFMLRAGSEDGERIFAASEPWRVPRSEAAHPSHAVLRGGELWLTSGEGSGPAGAMTKGSPGLSGRLPRLAPARTAAHPHRREAAGGETPVSSEGAEGACGRRFPRARPLSFTPLRI